MQPRFLAQTMTLFYLLMAPASGLAAPTATDEPKRATSEEIRDVRGDTFMQEVPSENSAQEKTPKAKVLPDLTRIDVPVDPNGHIVPLKNTETGPVLPFYSRIEQTVEPIYQPPPVWNYPYGGMPIYGFNPYAYGGYGPRPSIGIGLGGGAIRFGFGSQPRPYNPNPYGFAPASPWFVPPGMMPSLPYPTPYTYPPAYPMF
jgi:hypothetical protein